MPDLQIRLRRLMRLARWSVRILLLLIPIQLWQLLAAFSPQTLILLTSSILALGLAIYVLTTLGRADQALQLVKSRKKE